jgi:membrane-associated protein
MEHLLELVRDYAGPWALVAIFIGAALEYMVPPLPADSVVLAGSLLVVSGQQSFLTVLTVAVAGGMTGAFAHYMLGRALLRPDGQLRGQGWVERVAGRGSMERFFEAFRRRGMWVVVFNRAFPGVRAVTFLAAGAARLPLGLTMAAGLVSHLAWITAILWLGVSIGGSWEKIEAAFHVYEKGVYLVAGGGLVAYAGYRLWRRRQRAAAPDSEIEP